MHMAYLSGLPLAIAAIGLAIIVALALVARGRRAPAARTDGRIIGLVPAQGRHSAFDEAYPVIEFVDATGSTVRVTLRERLSRALHAVGETIAVAYDPANPKRAELAF